MPGSGTEFDAQMSVLLLQDNKTKTWPPKAPWQHSQPGQNMSFYQLSSPASHWNDPMQILPSPVWSAANDCTPPAGMASPFAYSQQPQQSPPLPPSQHKQGHKGFKSFPGKHERRPSYLPQYWRASVPSWPEKQPRTKVFGMIQACFVSVCWMWCGVTALVVSLSFLAALGTRCLHNNSKLWPFQSIWTPR